MKFSEYVRWRPESGLVISIKVWRAAGLNTRPYPASIQHLIIGKRETV